MEKKMLVNMFAMVNNQAFINACLTYTIRNGKRFGRYKLNLTKDLKRIKFLLRRSWRRFPLVLQELQDAIGVNGLEHEINLTDKKIPAASDFAEIVGLMEYWSLWDYKNEILALTGKH